MSDPLPHNNSQDDELSMGLKIVSFILPFVGAILYFIYKNEYPNKSRAACTSALWGVGFGIALNIIVTMTTGRGQ